MANQGKGLDRTWARRVAAQAEERERVQGRSIPKGLSQIKLLRCSMPTMKTPKALNRRKEHV